MSAAQVLTEGVHVVWFKRDLRVRDHRPLFEACARGPVLALYCFEPSMAREPDADPRQRAFIEASLHELAHDLARLGLRLQVCEAEVVSMLEQIRARCRIDGLWSHEETGNLSSFVRDQQVKAWCRAHALRWTECRQFGVFRGALDRNRWDARWESFMSESLAPRPANVRDASIDLGNAGWQPDADLASRHQKHQGGGRRAGVAVLTEFLGGRAAQYRGGISSPLKAPTACSRLSPYLAWGTLSMRELLQATRRRRAELQDVAPDQQPARLVASLKAFESRLHWHCHFIQKLESQPDLEQVNMHRGYDGLREGDFDALRFAAWSQGQTGYPLVDACMAMLRDTGWLNFRMRAMLMSFAAYHLWLHWREPGLHLARLFTDYEPGIHWPQVQMQSGVTGINALRIYNPVLQARQHDPQGRFVRHWLPALRRVPDVFIFEPWLMPEAVQREAACVLGRDYPLPIVDLERSLREARARYREWRAQPGLKEESQRVFERHGSRRRPSQRRKSAKPDPHSAQLALFD